MRHLLSPIVVAVLLCGSAFAHADDQADVKALIEQAMKAQGGADKIDKTKAGTIQMKGKFYGLGDGVDFTGTIAWQLPDKQRLVIESEAGGQKFKFTQIVNKDKGWSGLNENFTELDKDQMAEVREEMHAGTVTRLSPAVFKKAKLESLGEVKINDKPALGVRVEVKGYRDVTLFFDKASHRLVKSERRGKDVMNGGGEFNNETYYSDYKKVDGVEVPHKVSTHRDGKKFVESEITEYKPADKIDDAEFAKP